MRPLISIIIPGYNRPEPLKYTLRSVAAAAAALSPGEVETLLIDNGSIPPLSKQLGNFDPRTPVTFLRQENQGSIIARLHGLREARGEFILFLDSDDLIHPDKLMRHAAVLRPGEVDITYDDLAEATLQSDYAASYLPGKELRITADAAKFFLHVQPLPHCPIYRRSHLLAALESPLIPPVRQMDPAGDIWLYYNLANTRARIVKIDAPLTAIGPHPETRYSQHWERLSSAALLIAEGFVAHCPVSPETDSVRRTVGEVAFYTWRGLPRGISRAYTDRWLTVWRRSPRGGISALGGPLFRRLAFVFGPVLAGKILQLRNISYSTCRTVSDNELLRLWHE